MMKALLICPDRDGIPPFFTRKQPLALTAALGPSLLGHALTALAERGAREVTVLAAHRPDIVRQAVGRGEPWGLAVRVIAEPGELTAAEARKKYRPAEANDWLPVGQDIILADGSNLPGGVSPLESAKSWFSALERWLPVASERVGVREIQPNVWVGLRARVEAGAQLQGPCWIGEGAWVRAGAKVGPHAYVEDECLIDHDAIISHSWIAPRTYVGAFTEIQRSLAWGAALLNYESNSCLEVPDAFLLSALQPAKRGSSRSSVFARLLAAAVLAMTSPTALAAWLCQRRTGQPMVTRQRALVPMSMGPLEAVREIEYAEFPHLPGLWRRWPQLWNIVKGEFRWIGNRPITREQAKDLVTDFEQMWLAAPVGILSLADAEGCQDTFGDEARVHASFYAAQCSPKLDREIVTRLFRRHLMHQH